VADACYEKNLAIGQKIALPDSGLQSAGHPLPEIPPDSYAYTRYVLHD